MTMIQIMIYRDDTKISQVIEQITAREIHAKIVADEAKMYDLLDKNKVQLLLFDSAFGENNWHKEIDILQRIRKQTKIPIIVVSRLDTESAKIMALNAGADDYVERDVNPMVLLARMESQLRRFQQYRIYSGGKEQAYRIRGLELLTDKRIVLVDGDEVKLTPIEYNILLLLMENKGMVLSLARIYDEVWRMPVVRSDNTIAVHIRHIRKKIEKDPKNPQYLKGVWGCGYKLE